MAITKERKVTFPRGGVHPPEQKDATCSLPLRRPEPPGSVEVLMRQHIGAPARPVVSRRDRVLKGQIIGEAQGFISANVHSPVSGRVKRIENRIHNPSGKPAPAVIIDNDGEDEWVDGCNLERDVSGMDPEAMVMAVRDAGVVGLGGAAFPSHVKLNPRPQQSSQQSEVRDVIINGAECEPMLTCDHRLMLERTEEIIDALHLMMLITGAENGYVGIETNKPDAVRAFEDALSASAGGNISVVALRVLYPQGAEQQLITAVTGREVPAGGGLPAHVGCLVHNVATALAVRDAIRLNKPLIERPVTVAGDAVGSPGNFVELIGTSFEHILSRQGVSDDVRLVISGGPMMGIAQSRTDVPLLKGNSGILALSSAQVHEERSCIRCGRCVEACPLGLMPGEISILCENRQWEEALRRFRVRECKECGCCAYVCPARRRIVHMIKWCKSELAAMEAE